MTPTPPLVSGRPSAVPIAALLAALLLSFGGPASGQERSQGDTSSSQAIRVELELADFTGAVSPDGTFRLEVRITNRSQRALEDLRLVASFHRKAFHRADFANAVDAGQVGELWSSVAVDVPEVPGRRVATMEIRRTAEELGFAGSTGVQGVYPLVVNLQRDGNTIDSARTAVVVVSSQVEQPVRASVVVPIDAPPILSGEGLVDPDDLLDDLAPRGRLMRVLSGLASRPDVPVTFAIDGRLLDEAADLADGYTVLRDGERVDENTDSALSRAARGFLNQLSRIAGAPQVETVALPYGPADLNALVRGGMAAEAGRLVSEGRAAVERHSGVRPTPGVLLPVGGLTGGALSEAVGAGTDAVVLRSEYVELRGDSSRTASPVPVHRLRTSAGTTVAAALPDPWLSDLLADPDDVLEGLDPAVAVQRLVAETAMVYFERPNASETRGLLLTAPLAWQPPDGFTEGLAGALRAAPWLQPVSLSGLLDEIEPPDEPPARLSYPRDARQAELPQGYVEELRESRRALGSLAGVLAGDDETPGHFDRMLLTAAAVWFRESSAEGLSLIREVLRSVSELYAAVAVSPSPTILLSGVEGQIPVTVENGSSIPLRLRVRLETQRFTFEGGPSRTVLVPASTSQTVAFRSRARTPGGTYPIRVVVEDVDGALQLAEGNVVVRSTAVSAAALAVVVGAGLFLLGWWLRIVARRRRSRRAPQRADEAA